MAKKILLLILTLILSLGLFACSKEPEMVQVTFVGLDVEVIKTEEVVLGHTVAFPADPAVDGYEFTGWFLEKDEAKTEVISGFKPAKDTTLYAHFRELDSYTVTFVDHSGNVLKTIAVREDKKLEFPTDLNLVVEDEKEFKGWYLDGTNTKVDAAYFEGNYITENTVIRANCSDKVN